MTTELKLSGYFTLQEMIASDKAREYHIDNTPPPEIVTNLVNTCRMLDKIRNHVGCPVTTSSGYRCPKLNAIVGGSINSYHMKGQAGDLNCLALGPPYLFAKKILELRDLDPTFVFHELILEGTWVHVAIPLPTERPLFKVGTYKMIGGRKTWLAGLIK